MKKHLLIYGAGAIGRGYVPWVFSPNEFEFTFVESSSELRNLLNKNRSYKTYCTREGAYIQQEVAVLNCLAPGEELDLITKVDGVITAVGPRQVLELILPLSKATCPVVLFENDATLAPLLQKLTENPRIYFGVPDVITSNTAPMAFLTDDPLAIVTEDGKCFIEDGAVSLGGESLYVSSEELQKQWVAKLYIHNTPHCIAAYLGSLLNCTYLHEGMGHAQIFNMVEGAMGEMASMVKMRYGLDAQFVDWYAKKELSRFSNILLYDPINRVAREPFRKLEPHNRLVGAAQLALASGIVPMFILKGILSAFLYNKKNDPDFNITYLIRGLSPHHFLKLIINLDTHEALFILLVEQWDSIMTELKGLHP